MADLLSLLTQGLQSSPANPDPQPQTPQGAAPAGVPSTGALQALQQAAATQSQLQPPSDDQQEPDAKAGLARLGLDPDIIKKLIEKGMESPEDRQRAAYQKFFGLRPDQSAPGIGQTLKAFLKRLPAAALLGPAGVQAMNENAQKNYQLQTGRLGEVNSVEKLLTAIGLSQAKLDQKDREIGNLKDYRTQKLSQEEERNKALASARLVRNSILEQNVSSLSGVRSSEAANNAIKSKILQFQADHEKLGPGQVLEMLIGDEKDPAKVMQIIQHYNMATHPFASAGTVSTTSVDPTTGVPTTVNQKQFVNPGILGGAANFSPVRPGGNAAPGQASTPVTPAQTPNTLDLTNPRIPIPPGTPLGKTVFNARVGEDKKINERVHNIEGFEMNANNAAENLMTSMVNGKAKNFQGWLKGNAPVSEIRSMAGTVDPEEALQKLLGTDMLYSKLGANIRGRFTVPEIMGHLRNMGGLTQKPENALMAITALKLQADLMKRFERGDIKDSDMSSVTPAVISEMDRLRDVMRNMSPADKLKLQTTGALPPEAHIRDLGSLLQGRRNAAPAYGGFSKDDIEKELARRRK